MSEYTYQQLSKAERRAQVDASIRDAEIQHIKTRIDASINRANYNRLKDSKDNADKTRAAQHSRAADELDAKAAALEAGIAALQATFAADLADDSPAAA